MRRFAFSLLGLCFCLSVVAQTTYTNPVWADDFPDPSVERGLDGYFYSYATGQRCRKSKDLVHWEALPNCIGRPTWNDSTYVNAEGKRVTDYYSFWACDVSRVDDRYLMYYACALWGNGTRTGIGVATGKSPTSFTDRGRMFRSTEIGVHNSIDPVFWQEKDKKYLAWGSFHDIYITELTDDGLAVKDFNNKKKLAGGAFEGAMIHKRGRYYYLFCSVGSCCDGLKSTYRTVVGRSENLMGPYTNKQGGNMIDNNYTTIISGNDDWKGTGHNSEIITDDEGNDWLLYHAYSAKDPDAGRMMLIDKITWTADGWPTVNDGTPTSTLQEGPVFYTGDGANKTYLFENMDFGRSDFKYWTVVKSGDCAPTSSGGKGICPIGSVKNKGTFDIYRTKSDMPNGLYEFRVHAADTKYNVEMYVNRVATLVHNEDQTGQVSTKEDDISTQFTSTNDKLNFKRSFYGLVTDGTLRFGMRTRNELTSGERFHVGNAQIIYREMNAKALNEVLQSYYVMADEALTQHAKFAESYRTSMKRYRTVAETSDNDTVRYEQLLAIHYTLDSIGQSIVWYDSLQKRNTWIADKVKQAKEDDYLSAAVEDVAREAADVYEHASYSNAEIEDLLSRMERAVHDMTYAFERGNGTEANPYIIIRPEQLVYMHDVLKREQMVYFAMERDVDMAGYDWQQLNTSENSYRHWINFDGRGHVIRNLKPSSERYYPSFFGVLCGVCRNLGIIDAQVKGTAMGAGILSGCMGHSSFKDADNNLYPVVVENCYFTGMIDSKGTVGAVGGTLNDSPVTIRNVYSNVRITGDGRTGNYCGGIVGRVRTDLILEHCYSAGPISAPIAAPISAGGQTAKTPPSLFRNVIAWNKEVRGEGNDGVAVPFAVLADNDMLEHTYVFAEMKVNDEAVEGGYSHAALQQIAATWGSPWHFDATAGNGYPILKWQFDRGDYRQICGFEMADGIPSFAPDEIEEDHPTYYDVSGRRVSRPSRGVYIVKGKKMLF